MPETLTQTRGELSQLPPKIAPGHAKAREVWASPDSYATTLLVLFVDRYGTEALSWHPETIAMQVGEDFAVEVPRVNMDRLLAAITLVTTNYFYKRLSVFNDTCNVLSGDDFNPGVFQPADTADCAWGITEALLICPPDEEEPFTDEIRYYVGQLLRNEGYVQAPDILRIALGADLSDQIHDTFAEDPDMFQALHENQTEKTQQCEQLIRENLERLLSQIEALPLANGSAEQLRDRLRQNIRPGA